MPKAATAFRTISEVSDWIELPAHVLRFWETKFAQIRPVKGAGGRRYYRPEDMALLSGIKVLLHDQGLTIRGAQKLLREQGVKYVSSLGQKPEGLEAPPLTEPRQPTPLLSAIMRPAAPQISLISLAARVDASRAKAEAPKLHATLQRLEALRARLVLAN